MRQDSILNGAIVVLAVCAVLTTSTLFSRRWSQAAVAAPLPSTSHVERWKPLGLDGHRSGSKDAAVTIVEYSDFQCPYCAESAKVLRTLKQRYGDTLAVVFRHFPLISIHPYARGAAIASECASEQGVFEQFHDFTFANQDSLGRQGWTWFARRAHVEDVSAFEKCISSATSERAIDRDIAVGQELGVVATPTILVNDIRLRDRNDLAFLDSIIRAVLARP